MKTKINIKFHNTKCLHQNAYEEKLNYDDNCQDLIENVQHFKYLGVDIDCFFKWDLHIIQLGKRLRKAVYALHHLSMYTNFNVLKQVYFSLVESILRYGILAWGNTTPSYLQELQKIQNRVVKILIKAKNGINSEPNADQHTTYKQLGLLNIKQLFKLNILEEYYNNQPYKRPIEHQFNTRRRAQGFLQTSRFNNSYGRQQLSVIIPQIFNQVPRELLNISSDGLRKKLLRNHLLNFN